MHIFAIIYSAGNDETTWSNISAPDEQCFKFKDNNARDISDIV